VQVIIQGVQKDIPITSLILERDSLQPDMLKKFHCSDCGKFLFQYIGSLVMIVPGATQAIVPILTFCKDCKKRFLINSII